MVRREEKSKLRFSISHLIVLTTMVAVAVTFPRTSTLLAVVIAMHILAAFLTFAIDVCVEPLVVRWKRKKKPRAEKWLSGDRPLSESSRSISTEHGNPPTQRHAEESRSG